MTRNNRDINKRTFVHLPVSSQAYQVVNNWNKYRVINQTELHSRRKNNDGVDLSSKGDIPKMINLGSALLA